MSKSFFKGMQGSVWGLKGGGRGEGGEENWRGLEPSEPSCILKQSRTFVIVPDV